VNKVKDDKVTSLINRAKKHDESAMSELISLYDKRLLASIRHELGDKIRQRVESQDVMQQVYLDALDNIDRFEQWGGDAFFIWLRRIAVNRICDVDRKAFKTMKRGGEVRSADLGRDASMAHLLDAVGASITSPSMAVARTEHIKLLQQSLEKLSDDQREVIQLRYLNRLNVADTAEKMQRSERAVRSLCARAVIRLRELLDDVI